MLTAFTDGHVAVWRRTRRHWRQQPGCDGFELALVVRLHQSSIKCLDMLSLSSSSSWPSSSAEEKEQKEQKEDGGGSARWRVITGGDDNALGILDLARGADAAYRVLGRWRVRDAHAAAVTGLCVVGQEAGRTEVATASNDQRIKLWRIEGGGGGGGGGRGCEGVRVALLDDRYSSVADAGALELIGPGKLMVGGVGIEMWDVLSGREDGEADGKESLIPAATTISTTTSTTCNGLT